MSEMTSDLKQYLTEGITYFNEGTLCVSVNTVNPARKSLLQLKGTGYPPAANWLTLNNEETAFTAEDISAAIEKVYQAGYEQGATNETELKGVVFAGQGDPLLSLDLLEDVLIPFKRQRHGVPVTVVSFGLIAAEQAAEVANRLADIGVEKLRLYFPATDPVNYRKQTEPLQYGFPELCQFILAATDAGIQVNAFSIGDTGSFSELRAVAMSLGAVSFDKENYYP